MSELQPGADGDPLPEGTWVLRVCKKNFLSKEGRISELLFRPTDDDRKDPKNRLSIWAEPLTTWVQAFTLSNASPGTAVLTRLNVDDVRRIRPRPDFDNTPYLQVEWHPLEVKGEAGETIPDPRPGASGHSGIHDLTKGDRVQRKSVLVQLAELAQKEFDSRQTGQQSPAPDVGMVEPGSHGHS